jgi:hypothetical protein
MPLGGSSQIRRSFVRLCDPPHLQSGGGSKTLNNREGREK